MTYYKKADGKIDEAMTLSRNLKPRDLQTGSVILDFKKLAVVKANLNGESVPKDFNRIVEYYMQHYKSTIERLFKENGYEIDYNIKEAKGTTGQPVVPESTIDHTEPEQAL
jgi:hypothetical protein